jgi:membrane protein implicated in regulation of membrane protease activity
VGVPSGPIVNQRCATLVRYARAVGVLYLAALIVGAGTLLLQLFGSGDADAGQDLDHAAADADADAGGGHAHGVSGFVPIFLSLRFWTFGLLAFGLVGTLLHFLNLAPALLVAALALVMGFGSGLLASWVFRALSRSESSSGARGDDAVGQVGRVLVPCKSGHPGKVRVELRGQTLDFLATTDEASIDRGELVLVEEMRAHVAHVSRAPRDFLPPKP